MNRLSDCGTGAYLNKTWRNLSPFLNTSSSSLPPPRDSVGFASANGTLFLFGGNDESESGELWWCRRRGIIPAARLLSSCPFLVIPPASYFFCPLPLLIANFHFAGLSNDLHRLHPIKFECFHISGLLSGHPPSPRHSVGFASSDGMLYVFGGKNRDSGLPSIAPFPAPSIFALHVAGHVGVT